MVKKVDYIPDNAVLQEDGDDTAGAQSSLMKQRRDRFATMETYWSSIHEEALEDDKFVAGEQWPEQVKKDREEAGRPILTYNLLPAFTRQIINKVRQERPQIRVTPVESDRGQTPQIENIQGTKDYSISDVYMGLIRNIEHVSRADHAYDTALMHAVNHGFGYFMLRNQYSDSDPFVQELKIERVKNPYSIYLDPSAEAADLSDAQDGFKFSSIASAVFDKKYPDKTKGEYQQGTAGGTYEGWYDKDQIRIAEYYYIEHKDDEVVMMNNGKIHYYSEVKDVLDELKRDEGIYIATNRGKQIRKAVMRPLCMYEKITASDILEGPLELPFRHIPIFAVLGDEIMVEGRTQYVSAIRHAKDPQKSYNYWRTAGTETVALAPKAPWLITSRQIKGHQRLWEKANRENLPYLPYNHVEGQPPPQRIFASGVAAAELQNATQDSVDIQAIIGLHEASLGAPGDEKSGKAILARQSQGSTSTYTFPDNLNRALEHMGRVLVNAIPRIYDTQRVLRVRLPDDTEDFVEINQSIVDEQTGKPSLVHDIGYGKYDVVVETGPSYATQRQEALEVQLELLRVLPPELAGNIVHLVVKNMAMPGAEEVSRILRKLLPDNLKSEDERAADLPKGVIFDDQGQPIVEETGEPYQPPPTPEQQLAARQQELEQAKIDAETATAQAKIAKAEADGLEAQAKLQEVTAGQDVDGDGEPDYSGMLPEIERIIKQAFEEHEMNPQAHKDAIETVVTDAVVDALRRVRSYVDTKMPKEEEGNSEAAEADAIGDIVKKAIADSKPKSVNFERDQEGNITSAVPEYSEE